MTAAHWRNVAIALAVACAVLWWRGRRPASARAAGVPAIAAATPCGSDGDDHGARSPDLDRRAVAAGGDDDDDDPDTDGEAGGGGVNAWGIAVPDWVMWFAPQPGEDLLAYRDRLLPFAQAAMAPHRARVQRGLAAFQEIAHLDSRQRAELDAAVDDAGGLIQERVMQGVLSGELMPGRFKPMTGVGFASDVLDAVTAADQRFTSSLREDQKLALAEHPFDFADYLVFSVRWEDMLGVEE